uniref:Uncharacterized protein n=1 Tax=Candidatus Kentrum sp. LFY TaxID=2126342 RepID=A0A450UD03_9GAMM|nr:MAG: hypothetical protein BECKLFY1418A_GA0070994_101034 [Candidatus Kentron sp. LFY]
MRLLSTPDSVAENEPTVLAIIETLLAVAAYWGIAWWLDTHIHLLMSICVAPLLLLRSRESTDRGVRWFVDYWEDRTEITLETPLRLQAIVLASGLVSAACVYYGLADPFLVGEVGQSLFLRAFGLGMLATLIGIVTAVAAVATTGRILKAGVAMGTATQAGTIGGAIGGIIAVIAAEVGWVGIVGALVGVIAALLVIMVTPEFLTLPLSISSGTGFWLRSLGVRMLATLRHPVTGIEALPGNWRRILWAVDCRHAPELLPGLSAHDTNTALSLPGLMEKMRTSDWPDRSLGIMLIPIWFLPGFLYRWSLKSTCWLYLPLIYLGNGLWRPRGAREEGELVTSLHKSRVEGLRRALAVGVAASLVVTTALNHPALQGSIRESLGQFPLVLQSYLWVLGVLAERASGLSHLWAFDLFDLAPWQWLNLLGTAITGILFFYSDRANRIWGLARERDPEAAPEATHVTGLLAMARLRNLCAVFYVFLVFGYGVLALGGSGSESLTGWLGFLGTLYGGYL